MNSKKLLGTILIALITTTSLLAQSDNTVPAKRDFRGAWLHTVYQPQYLRQNTAQNKAYLISQLDSLQAAGINAVIFQVRPSADAFYNSKLEPWSRFLTKGGKAPVPYWDPLEFMVEEAHKRGMELHAWLNPYRVTTSKNEKLAPGHIYYSHPERFISYEDKMYFDPALEENRQFIVDVVKDIVSRYDIDAIHFDDYFYPYPGKTPFPDSASFKKYGDGMTLGDWRRHNVDLLIQDVNNAIKQTKPWVRFGISPFGIWRNKKTDPSGSETDGLANYDDLYADVMLWAKEGWIDYLAPQLYWNMEHPRASYTVLVDWWNKATPSQTRLYIGQDVSRTMSGADTIIHNQPTQLTAKMSMTRQGDNIDGNIWWPGYQVTRNNNGIADSLSAKHYAYPALAPNYPSLSDKRPAIGKDVVFDGKTLKWDAGKPAGKSEDAVRFVVYRFDFGKTIDLDDPRNICAVTPDKFFKPLKSGVYVITALDRLNNESSPTEAIEVNL